MPSCWSATTPAVDGSTKTVGTASEPSLAGTAADGAAACRRGARFSGGLSAGVNTGWPGCPSRGERGGRRIGDSGDSATGGDSGRGRVLVTVRGSDVGSQSGGSSPSQPVNGEPVTVIAPWAVCLPWSRRCTCSEGGLVALAVLAAPLFGGGDSPLAVVRSTGSLRRVLRVGLGSVALSSASRSTVRARSASSPSRTTAGVGASAAEQAGEADGVAAGVALKGTGTDSGTDTGKAGGAAGGAAGGIGAACSLTCEGGLSLASHAVLSARAMLSASAVRSASASSSAWTCLDRVMAWARTSASARASARARVSKGKG